MDGNSVLERVKEHTDFLSELLEDPQPGSPAWWHEVHRHWSAISRLWDNPGGGVYQDDRLALFEVINRDTGGLCRVRALSEAGAIKISNWPPAACSARRIAPREEDHAKDREAEA